MWVLHVLACFFFQAGDGIRARNVTGVQTCALPILREQQSGSIVNLSSMSGKVGNPGQTNYKIGRASCREKCRSWGSTVHSRKTIEQMAKKHRYFIGDG